VFTASRAAAPWFWGGGGGGFWGRGRGGAPTPPPEAAQQAISSPLLDSISIAGATGVLVNITGGADLTLGEVHQINEIIHDAVGDDAEIIFGAVHEPAMQGEIRVTAIATGFDRAMHGAGHVDHGAAARSGSPVIPFPANRPARVATPIGRPAIGTQAAESRVPRTTPLERPGSQDLTDMEIPTFIRRQMD
jgi:cell division protein FtsZ